MKTIQDVRKQLILELIDDFYPTGIPSEDEEKMKSLTFAFDVIMELISDMQEIETYKDSNEESTRKIAEKCSEYMDRINEQTEG